MIQHLILSLPLFVCGLLSVELMVSLWLKNDRARACLLIWSVTATVLYAMHYYYYWPGSTAMRLVDSVYTCANLSVYPLYLIYIYELTDDRPLRYRKIAVGMLFLFSVLCAVAVWFTHKTPWDEVVHQSCRLLFAIEVICTVVMGVRRIRAYHNLLDALYADPEERKLHSIHVILYILLVISLFSVAVNFLGRHYFLGSTWLWSLSVMFSCLLFAIGQVGLRMRYSIRDIEEDEAASPLQTVESQTPETGPLVIALKALIEDQRLFTQPGLKLDDVARRLGTNRTYLLRAMRQDLQMTFSEYINRLRIDYAIQQMNAHPDMSKADIAIRVGYGSLSSFYRNLQEYGQLKSHED